MEMTSKPVLEPHHQRIQSGENEAESKQQPERVLLVDQPYQSKKKVKKVELIKEPKRGLGVAKLEILRLEGKLKQVNEQLEQLQAEKEAAVLAAAPPQPQHQPQHQHQQQHQQQQQQQQQQQFQVPFPPFVDPRQQYPNGIVPVPFGRFVPVGNFPGAMKDSPNQMKFVFQPMNPNGGYIGEPMNITPNGGLSGNGGFVPGHHEPNNMNGNGGFPAGHHEPNNKIGNGGRVNGVSSNQNIAGNPYTFLDQQLRVQQLKLMHSARELCAIQRMQYHMPQHSKVSVQRKPIINSEEPTSKDKIVMDDSCVSLDLSLGSKTNIDEQVDDHEEVEEVDALGGRRRRRRSTSSVLMEYEFFPGESSDSRSSSYAGGGGMGSSEASTSDDNTHLLDLSLKLSL